MHVQRRFSISDIPTVKAMNILNTFNLQKQLLNLPNIHSLRSCLHQRLQTLLSNFISRTHHKTSEHQRTYRISNTCTRPDHNDHRCNANPNTLQQIAHYVNICSIFIYRHFLLLSFLSSMISMSLLFSTMFPMGLSSTVCVFFLFSVVGMASASV